MHPVARYLGAALILAAPFALRYGLGAWERWLTRRFGAPPPRRPPADDTLPGGGLVGLALGSLVTLAGLCWVVLGVLLFLAPLAAVILFALH